jgi:hypothetical protein
LEHQQALNGKSDRSDRYIKGAADLYIDEIETPSGMVYRIWDAMSRVHIAGDYSSHAEAEAEAKRRMQ